MEAPVVDVDAENANNVKEENMEQEEGGGTRKRSFVWQHFTIDPKSQKSKCPYCNHLMAAASKRNGTSAMKNHLLHVCTKSPLYNSVDKKKQKILTYKSDKEGVSSLSTHSFSQEKSRKCLAEMCIKDNRPFSIVEDEGLRDFVWELNPLFKFPSRWTIARDCWSIYEEEKKKLKKLLKDQTVSLTTDTWTSVQNFNYMCLTAHWVDKDWVLRKKIINFRQIANHKGETIGKLIFRCLKEWGIDRVLTVTVDNASSNDGAIKVLKKLLNGPHSVLDCKYLHLRCNAHIINLVVKEGLEEQVDSITRIRSAVRYVRSSPSRYASFKDSVENVKINSKRKPCLDVETRWNSTFLMLETALKFSKAFDRLCSLDSNYRSYFPGEAELIEADGDDESSGKKRKKNDKVVVGPPLKEDWESARLFMEFLKIFSNVTEKISGSKYVTSSLLFIELCVMHANITNMALSDDVKKQNMAKSMKKKFDKYWDNLDKMNFLVYVALVLDPRNKLTYLGYCLSLIYGNDTKRIKEMKALVKKAMVELFDEYKLKIEKSNEQKSTPVSSTSVNIDGYVDIDDGYSKYCENEGIEGVDDSEVEIYLRDGTEKRIKGDDKYDVLGWWKLNSVKFPILSQVARHVLALPISTVASESAFSTGGRVIDKYRSSLTSKTAESLVCAQDWLRSTPTDLQDSNVNGALLEELVENLEKIEDEWINGKNAHKDSVIGFEDEGQGEDLDQI